MTEYQVTIGYQGVICTTVKANSEAGAKELAIERFKKVKEKAFNSSKLDIQDDSFAAYGILDMDNTWNLI